MARLVRILLILPLFPPILTAVLGWLVAPSFLHPERRPLTPDLVQQADASFATIPSHREEMDVRTPDGVLLRGWKVRAPHPNGSWILLFHGVADNRMGVIEPAMILLRAGYGVTMMDMRAHGESEGPAATYGWLERNDTHAIVDALITAEHPAHIFETLDGYLWPESDFWRSLGVDLLSCRIPFQSHDSFGQGAKSNSALRQFHQTRDAIPFGLWI
jgi:hypothetical protein